MFYKIFYLGDMPNADVGVGSDVLARVWSTWKKFRVVSHLGFQWSALKLEGSQWELCLKLHDV